MVTTIEALFPGHQHDADTVVSALNHQQIVVALSALVAPQRVAILHMLYPRSDARTHRSLDALVNVLHGHGLHQVATLIEQEAHYLVFRDPVKAWKAFQEIRHDSLAIGVHLYYKGHSGEAAERELDADAHHKA
ncbi:hypothetical protein BKK79_03560 [Cupriavidus sp. USMAA2-4]|uniref:hypothetical protein n=1 Tax=unclassified Cupriavidus TaxID=2640874 RepID=UPI0008A69AE0|nr:MULTISPECIES: hypothetical protein [unclassified Cupriavidus]AOY90991.1 hypothetical protein BKK79_03560 [Cupriavidus sp. USMAA2-4]AOY99436.1 hypothetical protein BKK81_09275 [Cupriavidus sp. USMAHM13]